MNDPAPNGIAGPQREVQRLLGRCLLRLQQYERQLKAVAVDQALSGTPETLEGALQARTAEFSDKTLGLLVRNLMDEYIVPEGSDSPGESAAGSDTSTHVDFRARMTLRRNDHETLKADLRRLVTLRNTLVHHFIDQYDLWTIDGCVRAQDALLEAYAEIDRHTELLRTFAGDLNQMRRAVVQAMEAPEFIELIVNGIAPDGRVHWPKAGIVSALDEAFRELAIDGWANLDTAVRWVSEHHPEQTPQKYGCSRWRHVVHESGQFEMRRFTHNGQFGAWFRKRPVTSG